MGCLITVSGAVGGVGASTFAYALALQSASPAVLIDGQDGAPLDVLVGAESAAGVRWSQVHVRSDAIAAGEAIGALLLHHGVRILASDALGTMDDLAARHLVQVLRAEYTVVLDLPARHGLRMALQPDLDIVLLPPTLPGIAALAHARLRSSQLVVVDTGAPDLHPRQWRAALGSDFVTLRWQRAVRLACTAGVPLPAGTDAMRSARELLSVVADVH